eukprot:a345318_6.p3 GENE.a345318_6~~a345318_6.p3  ORF type:complete len:131 (+),score=34.84 a345318_6:27-395(+)
MTLNPWTTAAAFVVVSLLWGLTNPLLKRTSASGGSGWLTPFANPLWFFAFVINQLGSVLNLWLLGDADMTVAVPVTAALTLVFTALSARALGEPTVSMQRLAIGTGLICAGIATCVAARAEP